jgi:hypothetical protein
LIVRIARTGPRLKPPGEVQRAGSPVSTGDGTTPGSTRPVQRVAFAEQLAQFDLRVDALQQRALRIVAQAPRQFVGRGAQIEHGAATVQRISVGRAQHRAATGGQHDAVTPGQRVDDTLLDVAEGRLAVLLEVVPDAAADLALDLGVAVDEISPELPCQVPPDRGLATAGHADEGEDHSTVSSGWCRAGRSCR